MQKLTCFLLTALAACATTEFVRTVPRAGNRLARPASEVELFFGTEPQKGYEKVGYFERAPSDYVNDTGGDLAAALRRSAGYEGCDGVIIPPKSDLDRLALSSSEKAKAYCVMFGTAANPQAEAPVNDSVACEKGKPEACIRAGIEAEQKQEIAAAFGFYEKACAAPNPRGCTHKAIMLLQAPSGVTKDEAQALELFAKACVLDDPIACRYQGVMYVEGKGGVQKSALGGLGFLDKACTAKDGWACWRIAQVYKKGEGTAKDDSKAKTFEQSACANGYTDACAK